MSKGHTNAGSKVTECPFPVGWFIHTASAVSPASIYADTTWEQIKDRGLVAAGDVFAAGETGGNKEITQTVEQMPEHGHDCWAYTYKYDGYDSPMIVVKNGWWDNTGGIVGVHNTGGGQAMNIMNPYLAAYCWQRIA